MTQLPGGIITGFLQLVLEAVFEPVCYLVGRCVVTILSVGQWKCDRLATKVPRHKLRAAGLYHVRDERITVTAEATQLLGFVSAILVLGAVALGLYLRSR